MGLGVGPSQVILGVGETRGSFTLYNGSDIEETITLAPVDFSYGPDGQRMLSDIPLPQGAASWVHLDALTFDLGTEESRTVTFTLEPPVDATPGDHMTMIGIDARMSNAGWDRFRAEHPTTTQVNIRSRITFNVDVVARTPGEILPDVHVPPFEVFLPGLVATTSGDILFTPQIQNAGNVAAVWLPTAGLTDALESMVPTLSLSSTGGLFARDDLLFEGTRTSDKSVNLAPLVVLPGATHTQRLTMADAPLFGTYDYVYTLPGSVVDGRATITQIGQFTVVNLQKVLLWIVLPLLTVLTLLTLFMLRRRHVSANRRRAAEIRAGELQHARQEAYEQAWREQQARLGQHH